jgi:hypothetical protein
MILNIIDCNNVCFRENTIFNINKILAEEYRIKISGKKVRYKKTLNIDNEIEINKNTNKSNIPYKKSVITEENQEGIYLIILRLII